MNLSCSKHQNTIGHQKPKNPSHCRELHLEGLLTIWSFHVSKLILMKSNQHETLHASNTHPNAQHISKAPKSELVINPNFSISTNWANWT